MIDIFTVIDTPDGWQPPPPATHHDPAGGYGFTPDPVTQSPWWRSYEALELAKSRREGQARWFADRSIDPEVSVPLREIAGAYYRQAVGEENYAHAVYKAEKPGRLPRASKVPA